MISVHCQVLTLLEKMQHLLKKIILIVKQLLTSPSVSPRSDRLLCSYQLLGEMDE